MLELLIGIGVLLILFLIVILLEMTSIWWHEYRHQKIHEKFNNNWVSASPKKYYVHNNEAFSWSPSRGPWPPPHSPLINETFSWPPIDGTSPPGIPEESKNEPASS